MEIAVLTDDETYVKAQWDYLLGQRNISVAINSKQSICCWHRRLAGRTVLQHVAMERPGQRKNMRCTRWKLCANWNAAKFLCNFAARMSQWKCQSHCKTRCMGKLERPQMQNVWQREKVRVKSSWVSLPSVMFQCRPIRSLHYHCCWTPFSDREKQLITSL